MDKKQETKEAAPSSTSGAFRINNVALGLALVFYIAAILVAIWMIIAGYTWVWISVYAGLLVLIGTYFLLAIKIAAEWEKAVLLRLGKFRGLRGPGLFWVIPGVDTVANWIDHRVMVTPFNAEKTLTKDATQLLPGVSRN